MEVRRRKIGDLGMKLSREEELKDIAKASAREALKISEGEDEDETNFDSIDEFEEQVEDEASSKNEIDAFIMGDRLEKAGISYEFKIMKDHQHLCFWSKPLNEDILAKEFGGGHYIVKLYKLDPKKFQKQTTVRIADQINKAPERIEVKDNTEVLLKVIEDRSRAMEESFREKEIRLEREREREREEYKKEREREREERRRDEEKRMSDEKNGKGNMLEMLEVLSKIMPKVEPPKDNSDQFYKMMMEMQKSTASLIEKMNEKNLEMIKDLKADTKDLIEKMKPKKDGMSDVEFLMKIQEAAKDAKKEARDEMMMFNEMVEAKALEKAEMLSGQGPKEEKEDSVINNLISSLGPMLVQGVMKGRQQAAIQAAQTPRQIAAPVQAKPSNNGPVRKKARPLPPQMQKKTVEMSSLKEGGVTSNEGYNRSGAKDSTGQNTVNAAPVAERAQAVEIQPQTTFQPMNSGHTINLAVNNLEKTETSPIIDREEEQDRVGAVISGVIMEGVQAKKPALEVSNKCYTLLSSANLITHRVFEYFPKSLLIELRDSYSPETPIEWINEFYDNLQTKFSHHGEYEEPRYGEVN
jgi:hypothetical protein